MSGYFALLVLVLLAMACGTAARGGDGGTHSVPPMGTQPPETPLVATPIDPAPVVAGSVAMPYQPAGCTYRLPAVEGQARLVPHGEAVGAAPDPANLHLTLVADPAHSVVVQWNTDDASLASEVRFGLAGQALDSVALGYSFVYGGSGGRREHEVHVCGLLPSRRYHYVAGGSGHVSEEYSFVTAPDGPQPVRVMVAGDARSDPATWGRIADRAMETDSPDVLLFTGDAVVDGANQERWNEFFSHGARLLASVPSLWVDGNHEGISSVYFALFAFPDNGQPRRHEHWYQLDYGPMRVIALNDTTLPRHEISGDERDFLRGALSTVDRLRTPWVVTMHHQPIYSTSDGHLPDQLTRMAWAPLFDRYHVDVDFSGHVHDYESTLPIRDGAITDSTLGTVYLGFGGGGAPLYHFRGLARWDRTRESTHGYAIATFTDATFTWTARRTDGSTIETFTLPRAP